MRTRTFRKKVDTREPDDDDPKVKALKSNTLAFNVYFDDNEKLYSFYLMCIMTHSFLGIKLDEDVFTIKDFKLIFNTAYTMIKYMDKRYSQEIKDKIIQLKPLNGHVHLDALAQKLLEEETTNWTLMDKVRRELNSLERIGTICCRNHVAFFYEILWYYYHDAFSKNKEKHVLEISSQYIIFF